MIDADRRESFEGCELKLTTSPFVASLIVARLAVYRVVCCQQFAGQLGNPVLFLSPTLSAGCLRIVKLFKLDISSSPARNVAFGETVAG
jgi:hypothetical protein